VKCRGRVVSSSQVRRSIECGDVALACRFLNRPYAIAGDVVTGHGIGSKQTVPTLNLRWTAEVLPRAGVYITRTHESQAWNSITNVGYRPTFANADPELSIETFLLDPLDGSAPRQIRVEFLRRVREERKFDSPEALKAQILKDVGRAQAFFRRSKRWISPPAAIQ
jgi:riboflavin kinase/FMN adenylyltransferase